VCTDGKASWLSVTWDKKSRTSNIVCATVDDWKLIFEAFQKHFDTTPKEFDEDKWLWLRPSVQLLHVPGGAGENDASEDDEGYLFVSDADAMSTSVVGALRKFEFEHVSSLLTEAGPRVMFGESSKSPCFRVHARGRLRAPGSSRTWRRGKYRGRTRHALRSREDDPR
jgi:hypothetical protein